MIELTESAADQIRKLASEQPETKRLRLLVEPGGCSGFEYGMSFDDEKANDVRVESAGVEVLVDPTSFEYLKGCRVHFDDGLSGKGFEIINPNAQSTCGCGRSFN